MFALKTQIYIYKNRELFDCVKTAQNDKGIYSCATFKDDESRFMIATLSEKSVCSLQIRDFTFDKDYHIENVFGEDDKDTSNQVGDLVIDDFGERLFTINA